MKHLQRLRFLATGALLVTSLVACAGPASPATPTSAATSVATVAPIATPTPAALTADALKNAAYQGIYEGQTVQLTDGKYEGKSSVEGGASRPTVTFTGDPAFGDLNGDGVTDAVVTLVESSGGSGSFFYLAAVINRNGSPENVVTKFLGDRVKIESIIIEGGEITVRMLTQGPKDPMCCPSQKATVKFRLEGNQLVTVLGLEETGWKLVSYGDPTNPKTVLPGKDITIVFNGAEGRVNGSAGCNLYFGGFKIEGQKLSFSALGSTKMACEEGLMNQEQVYLTALGAAERYEIDGSQLRIFYASGQVLVFAGVESGKQ